MSTYKLILEVTCEQELAIKLLFTDRGWKFLTHGVIAKANNIRNQPVKPRKLIVKRIKNLPISQQPKAALNSTGNTSLQEKTTIGNVKSKYIAVNVNTKEKNELQQTPNIEPDRTMDSKQPHAKFIPKSSELNPIAINTRKTPAVQSISSEKDTRVKHMPQVSEPNHVPNKTIHESYQIKDSPENVPKVSEPKIPEPSRTSIEAIKTSDLTQADANNSLEREIPTKSTSNNSITDNNDKVVSSNGHKSETITKALDWSSDVEESTEENLCITNLQRKRKLQEKTALAKSGGQKRPCVLKEKRDPLVEAGKSNCITPVDKSYRDNRSTNSSSDSRNTFVKDKFNIDIPASKIVRTLEEQEHVISECVKASVDKLTDIQTNIATHSDNQNSTSSITDIQTNITTLPNLSDIKTSALSLTDTQTNVLVLTDIQNTDPVLRNIQTAIKTLDIEKTDNKKPLPSLESILSANNDTENTDGDILDTHSTLEVNSSLNNKKSDPEEHIHDQLESDKMCQTEFDAPTKQVEEVTNKSETTKQTFHYKPNDENDIQNLNKTVDENSKVDNQFTRSTVSNISSNDMNMMVANSSIGNMNQYVNHDNTSNETTENLSNNSVKMNNMKMVKSMNVMKEKSMNVMNKLANDANNVSRSVNEQHTRLISSLELKQLPYSTKKKESSVELEKRVLDLLPKDLSTQVRQMLSVHRSWTDPTTTHHLSCPYCKHELKNPIYFVRHLEKHIKREYDCPSCGKQFGNRRLLKAHLDNSVNGTLNCDLCDFRASNACMLRRHRKSEHKSPAGLQCHLCATMVKCQSYLTVHLKIVHGIQSGKYECEICGKKCARPKWLEKHMKEHQEKPPTPTCSLCNKTFPDKKTLRQHFVSNHKEKDNLCKECGKTFVSSSKLLVHERTHSGEKPFACDQCDYRTTQKSNLRMHLKTHDHGENTLDGLGVIAQKKAKLKESLVGTAIPLSNISQQSLSQSHKQLNDSQMDGHNKTGSHQHIQTGSPHQGVLQSTVNKFREPSIENSSHNASESQNYLQNGAYDQSAMASNYYNTAVVGGGYETSLGNKDGYPETYMNPDQAYGNEYSNSVNALHNMQQYTATLYGNEELPDSTDDDDDDDDETSGSEMEDSYDKDTDDDGEMTFQELLGRDDIPPNKTAPPHDNFNPTAPHDNFTSAAAPHDNFTPTDSAFTDKQTFEFTSALQALHPELQNTSSNMGMYDTSQLNQFSDNNVDTYHQSFNYDMSTGDSDPLMNIQKYEQGFEELLRGSLYDVNASTSADVTNQRNTHQQNTYNHVAVKGGKGANSEHYPKYDGVTDHTNDKDWSMYNVSNTDSASCNTDQLSSFYQAFQGMSYPNYDPYYGDGTHNMASNMAYHHGGTGNQSDSNSLAYQSGNHMTGSQMSGNQIAGNQMSGKQIAGNQMTDMVTGQYNYDNNYSGIPQHPPAYQMSKTTGGDIPVTEMGYNGDFGYNSMNDTTNQAYQTNYNQMLQQMNQAYTDLQGPVSYLEEMHTES